MSFLALPHDSSNHSQLTQLSVGTTYPVDERMMGYGLHGGSSSSSSNLSALAPPFTVDRTVPKSVSGPLVDLTESNYPVTLKPSLHNWFSSPPPSSNPDFLHIPSTEFDSAPSSNAYIFSSPTAPMPASALPDAVLPVQSSNSFVEAKPYYPSYVSPTSGDDGPLLVPHQCGYDLLSTSHVAKSYETSPLSQSFSGMEHSAQWGGLWEGLADWRPNKQVQLDGSFCPKQNCTDQGFYGSKGLSKYEEAPHIINVGDTEKHIEFASTRQLDYKSFLGEKPKCMPTDCPTISALASISVVPETHLKLLPLKAVNSGKNQKPYSTLHGNFSGKRDNSPDSTSVTRPSPAVVIRSPVQDTPSSKDKNTSSDVDDKDFACSSPSIVRDPHPFMSFESNARFDANLLKFHLEQDEHIPPEFSSIKNEKLPSSKGVADDILDCFLETKAGIQVPHSSLDDLAAHSIEAIDSGENGAGSSDHYNPAVDSPCWRGASVSCLSPLVVCEAVTSQNLKKLEVCNGSNLHSPQVSSITVDAARVPTKNKSETQVHHDNRSPEVHVAPLKWPSVSNMLFTEGIDDLKSGPRLTNPSYCHAVKISDDIHLSRKDYVVYNKSMDSFECKPLLSEQQCPEESKLASEKYCAPGVGVACVGMNVKDDPANCSSHVPIHTVERVLCSPPAAEGVPNKLTKSHKMYVRTLVNTIQNLSELLLFHCMNDECELKEEDCEALKGVVNNLDTCVFRTVERMASTKESLMPQGATSQYVEKLSKLHEGTDVNAPQVSMVKSFNFQRPHKYHQHVGEEPGKKDEKLFDFASVNGAADTLKVDKMTQAIKKVLAENFHEEEAQQQMLLYRNLWLEAEASLCSVNYMARFNRMKSEMAKCSSQKLNVLPENTMLTENFPRSKVFSDPYNINTSVSDNTDGAIPDASITDLSVLGTSSHADAAMARFHILKCGNYNSANTLSEEKMSSSTVSPNPNTVATWACKASDNLKPDVSMQDSPTSNTSSQADVEASVMARFCILKRRIDNSTSVDTEEHQLVGIDLGHPGPSRHRLIGKDGSEERIVDVNMEPVLQNRDCNHAEDKSNVEEFHLLVNHNQMTAQSCRTDRLGDQPRPGWYESSSSDWEHVLKEELA